MANEMKLSVDSLEELEKFCHSIIPTLGERAVILLRGPMAAGKTQVVKAFVRHIGLNDVTSPTFALHQIYKANHFTVDHFDLYRLETSDDLETAGFWDVFHRAKGWVFVEWSEKLGDDLRFPPGWQVFSLELSPNAEIHPNYRQITFRRLRLFES